MPDDPAPPFAAEIAAAEMDALRFLHTRLREPLDIPVGKVSALAIPGESRPPIEMGIWRVEKFGDLIALGKCLIKKEVLLQQRLDIQMFLYLVEKCGLTEPGDIPSKEKLKT